MIIEVGKRYKTRDGSVYEILKTDASNEHYPVIGVDVKYGVPCRFTKEGRRYQKNNESGQDLVSEYSEPLSWEGWVRECNGVILEFHKNHPDVIELAGFEQLIKVRITEITEDE